GRVRGLPRQHDPAPAVLSVRHQLREDDAPGGQHAAAAAVRAVQRAEPGGVRRAAVREQPDQFAVRDDRSQRRAAVELPALRAGRDQAVVLIVLERFACAAILAAASVGAQAHTTERARRIEYSDLPSSLQHTLSKGGVTADRFPAYVRDVET